MPRESPAVYRRRRIAVFGSLGVVLALLVYLPSTLLAPVPTTAASIALPTTEAPGVVDLDWPDEQSASAIGAVGFDGPLAASGDEGALPIASITKIVTALVVLDEHPLGPGEDGPQIEFTRADVELMHDIGARNGKTVWVTADSSYSQREVLAILIVASGNNYAESLARWAFGSQEGFLDAARSWLDEHGLGDIRLNDATGLSRDNVATTSSLLRLAELAVAHPVVAELAAMPAIDLPGLPELENTNLLLGVDGVSGLKTGTLSAAGACLLFSAEVAVGDSAVTVVGVVLGAETHKRLAREVRALLDSARAGFAEVRLASAGDDVGDYVTEWGRSVDVVVADDVSAVLWSGVPTAIAADVRAVSTGERGDDVGTLTITAGDDVFEVPLELADDVPDPGAWWRLTNPVALF